MEFWNSSDVIRPDWLGYSSTYRNNKPDVSRTFIWCLVLYKVAQLYFTIILVWRLSIMHLLKVIWCWDVMWHIIPPKWVPYSSFLTRLWTFCELRLVLYYGVGVRFLSTDYYQSILLHRNKLTWIIYGLWFQCDNWYLGWLTFSTSCAEIILLKCPLWTEESELIVEGTEICGCSRLVVDFGTKINLEERTGRSDLLFPCF